VGVESAAFLFAFSHPSREWLIYPDPKNMLALAHLGCSSFARLPHFSISTREFTGTVRLSFFIPNSHSGPINSLVTFPPLQFFSLFPTPPPFKNHRSCAFPLEFDVFLCAFPSFRRRRQSGHPMLVEVHPFPFYAFPLPLARTNRFRPSIKSRIFFQVGFARPVGHPI